MSFTRLRYHLVTGTKRRDPMISPDVEPHLYQYMREAAEEADGQIIELGGIEDHVHILAAIRPDVAPSTFMQRVKSESTRRLCAEHEEFDHFQWQTGFSGFTLPPFDLDRVRSYVRNQKEHHRDESIWEKFEIWEEVTQAA